MAHCRKLTIGLPCLLVCGLVLGADKAAEQFNGSAMRQEFSLNVGVDVRPVMGAVVASDVDEGYGWCKGCSERCTRGTTLCNGSLFDSQLLLIAGEVQGQPVGQECANQSTKKGGNQITGHGLIRWQVLTRLAGLLIGGELMLLALRRNWVRRFNV